MAKVKLCKCGQDHTVLGSVLRAYISKHTGPDKVCRGHYEGGYFEPDERIGDLGGYDLVDDSDTCFICGRLCYPALGATKIAAIIEASKKRLAAKKKFYVLLCEGGVELSSHGPYETFEARDKKAKQLRKADEDNIAFWMDINEAGGVKTGSYSGGFMDS
jgi:hypothetical protein